MIKKISILFCGLAGYGAMAQPVQWPHHKKAAIVLTYDDALRSQLDTAVPQLRRAGLKATFFLTADIDSATIPRWRALAKEGYELANHTVYHPCINGEDNPVSSDHYTPYQMIREIEVMNHLLYAVDGRNSRTYAYPCTETTVGGKDYVDTLRRYGLIKYARVGGDTGAVIADPANVDPLRVPALGLEDHTPVDRVIGFVKSVEQSGGMGIIMFHGIGGDYITTDTDVHQKLLDYLARNRSSIWVGTFQEVMDFVKKKGHPGGH
ncbi:polysaccharide deacetylase family protein [Puia sp.]|jgi:peptidoglycan/xylan/chitin deacetylase (PgdA/CDA1 family)|uniref:polysaccharide deacetylase family protein n=1 Tax=Puia sp. TaxID=2045100 RepID=UPI002F41AAC5